jgi:ferredoxin
MALTINTDCTECDACVPVCPNEAITKGTPYVIDPLRCTECVGAEDEPQCQLVCPVTDCIVPNPDYRESREELLAKYKSLHA